MHRCYTEHWHHMAKDGKGRRSGADPTLKLKHLVLILMFFFYDITINNIKSEIMLPGGLTLHIENGSPSYPAGHEHIGV